LPEAGNLYGRSVAEDGPRHRFLPAAKGGLYVFPPPLAPRVIVAEGLMDVAALWQAGFGEAVAALGCYPNQQQFAQLCRITHCAVYLCFDSDPNGSGQRAARRLCRQLRDRGVEALRVELPSGHDPASFFASGAAPSDLEHCLDEARP
jgi:DNA primase